MDTRRSACLRLTRSAWSWELGGSVRLRTAGPTWVTSAPLSQFSTLFAPLSCYLRDLGKAPFPFGGFHHARLRPLNRSPETIFVLAVLFA